MNKPLPTLLLVLASSAQAYDFEAIATQHILPVYQQLVEQTTQLNHAAQSYCAQPGGASMETLRSEYSDAFLAWQGAQHLRLGPVQYLSREHRFAMWPDKRGKVRKHLARLKQDPDLQSEAFDISSKSVAVQGFSALERLLFGNSPPDQQDCRIATAITGNLQDMGTNLLNDWSGGEEPFVDFFKQPSDLNPIFESDEELASRLLNSLYTELEVIVTQKLARPLGDSRAKARGKRAESWRSGNALAAISANLNASEALYQQAFAAKLAGTALGVTIDQHFRQARQTLDSIQKPLAQAVSDATERSKVEQLQREVSMLKGLVGRDMAAKLGLSLGFNALDGD